MSEAIVSSVHGCIHGGPYSITKSSFISQSGSSHRERQAQTWLYGTVITTEVLIHQESHPQPS